MNLTHLERFCRNLDWNLLFTFFVVVEEKGVTKAAKRLLVTQPAVTNALKRLETHFDCALIDRTAHTFSLTRAGQLLFEEVTEMRGSVSRIAVTLKDTHDEVTGNVTVHTATHAESAVIDAALVKFHKLYPKASLSISVVTSGDIMTSVRRKVASCGIGLVTGRMAGLEYEVIYRERFALYCGAHSALFERKLVDKKEVISQPYITYPTDEVGGELHDFTVARQEYGIRQTPVARSYYLEELRRLIELGIGIGPLPIHVAQRYVDLGRLWQIPVGVEFPTFEVNLITNPRTKLNSAEMAFIHIMSEQIKRTPLDKRSYF